MATSVKEVRIPFPTNNKDQTSVTYEEIALKLLNEKFLLTALELHAELCEAGRELPILKDFFNNPSNFESQNLKPEPYTPMPRSSSQATLDSLDMTRYSEDGAGVDERVAILEFELRKARDNISALRQNLTVVTESEGTAPNKSSDKHSVNNFPIKPHEQRALNFLVNEYLLARSYKLTSITFSDENEDQDFEDWEDVGLNIPKPSQLLQIYREYIKTHGYDKPSSVSIALQTEPVGDTPESNQKNLESQQTADELEQLRQQVITLEQEKQDLHESISSVNNTRFTQVGQKSNTDTAQSIDSHCTTPEKFEIVESQQCDISAVSSIGGPTLELEEEDSASTAISLGETDPGDKEWTTIRLPPRIDLTEGSSSRNLPLKFKVEILSHCLNNASASVCSDVEAPLKRGINRDTLVEILAQALHRIVPNVILNKREETIPLILSAFHLHSDQSEKEKLLQLLFNLKKRPQDEERQMILAGLTAMAKLDEAPLEREEILTICWEQSQHKYPERRLLAVECCSALALYTSSSIRNSLMLSMLQQMLLDDKDPTVRASVVKSLALLVALMDDPDKYFQCEELAMTALQDSSAVVVNTASSIFIPILAQWSLALKRLLAYLLPRIISKLKNQLKPMQSQHSPGKEHKDEERIVPLIQVLQNIIPHVVVCVADTEIVRTFTGNSESSNLPEAFSKLCCSSMINPKIFYDGDMDVGLLLDTFFSNTWENDTWPELEWLMDKLVPDILEMFKSLDVAQENILNAMLAYMKSVCSGFGRYITQTKILPIIAAEVTELKSQLTTLSGDNKSVNLMLIPAHLIVLSTLSGTELSKSLREFLVLLSMSSCCISGLRIAVIALCSQEEMQEHILTSLWDGVVHQRSSVRCATASLLGSIIPHVSDRLANARLVPAIVTLANDPELNVRAATIPALGRLMTECKVKEARDKARLSLETIAREPQGVPPALAVPLVSTLASIAANCSQSYVEDVIATQLTAIAASALQQNRRVDLVNALVDAYSVLVYSPLGSQCISGILLPGLKYLETLVNQAVPQQKETIRSLLREAESRQDSPRTMERSSSTSSGLSLSMATVNVGQGVEDMRQRMSKIFQQKASSPSIPSIFRKK